MAEKERMSESPKGDVEDLFQKMGAKLGWFQFKDVNSAINTLSQSAKKKSSRSRIAEKSAQKINSSKRKDKSLTKAGNKSVANKKQEGKRKDQLKPELKQGVGRKQNRDDSSSPSPDNGRQLPAESTRIGSSVFRSESNSFVDLSLSPVRLNSALNNSEFDGSYEALQIRRKSYSRNHSELDKTDKHFTTCYPGDADDIFYSVLNPDEKSSNETQDKYCIDLTSPGSVKSSENSDYIEVEDKAVSTGSLELQLLEKLDLNYEHERSYFKSWAIDNEKMNDESKPGESKNSNPGSSSQNCSENSLSEPTENVESSSQCSPLGSGNSKTSTSIVESEKSSEGSDLYEVEDKCVGTEQVLSEYEDVLDHQNSPSVNRTVYFDTEEPVLVSTSGDSASLRPAPVEDLPRRKSVAEKSVYYEVSDATLPTTGSGYASLSDDSLPELDQADRETNKENFSTFNARGRKKYTTDSSEEDDDLDNFFSKMRTPLRERLKQSRVSSSLEHFLVDDDEVTSEEEDGESNSGLFHVNVNRKLDTPQKTKSKNKPSSSTASRRHVIDISDSDEENEAVFKTTAVAKPVFKTPKPVMGKKTAASSSLPRTPLVLGKSRETDSLHKTEETTFLKSLSPTVPEYKRHADATRFVKQFKKLKEELVKQLFVLYNTSVFENQLPSDLPIKWNCRLLKTAGYCRYRRSKSLSGEGSRSVEIELSTKVCDSTERVRDTLIHELCHAAVWLINGTRDGHGPYWKYWAKKSNYIHPELPIINRCHNYSINTKYIYKCTQCGYQLGRHSKSLDTSKKVCGLCHGKFELLVSGRSKQSSKTGELATPTTPRTASKFALFVKENYKFIKQSNSDFKHKDVMGALSKEFAEKNKIKDN